MDQDTDGHMDGEMGVSPLRPIKISPCASETNQASFLPSQYLHQPLYTYHQPQSPKISHFWQRNTYFES